MKYAIGLFAIVLITAMAVSAMAGIVYVKKDCVGPVFDGASWMHAFQSVQAGVDAAAAGDEVWVAAGDYPESVILKGGVKLLGGYSGVGDTRDIRACVSKIISCSIGGGSTLEGFAVQGNTEKGVECLAAGAVVRANTISGSQRYGIYSANWASTIWGNTITMSTCETWGCCYGVYAIGGKVNANRVTGADVGIGASGAVVTNNVVVRNHIGIQMFGGGTNTRICLNLAHGNSGAGILISGQFSLLINGNAVIENGVGIDGQYGGTASYSNVYGNGADYSGLITHTNDISFDPCFENPEAGDYRLTPNSPCIDRTLNYLAADPQTDMAGNPRRYGAKYDIGPYEFQPELRISMSPSDGIVHVMDPGDVVSGISRAYTLTNISADTTMSWRASKTAEWLDLSNTVCVLEPGRSSSLTVSINSSASALPPGRYSDLVKITNTLTGEVSTRNVRLIVGRAVCVNQSDACIARDGTTWDKGFATISEALDIALPGQEIWVAKGVYREALDIGKNVVLRGGYLGEGDIRDIKEYETTIERDGDYGDTIVTTSPCIIDGFTITKGFDGVYSVGVGGVVISNCTLKGNTNTGAALRYAPGTVSSSNVTGNRYGLTLYTSDSVAVNNLLLDNTGYNISVVRGARAANNTMVGSGPESGLQNSGTGVINNLSVDRLLTNPDTVFVNAAAGDYRLLPGASGIDAGVSEGAPGVDKDGSLRPMDGDGDGVAKLDLGCYEFGVSNMARVAQAKSLADGTVVGLASPVVTASLNDRFYVENPDRIGGIGVIGQTAAVGKRVAIEGTVETVDGEKMIRPTSVIPGVTASVPAPWYVNFNSLGGGALGLQAGVSDWRPVQKSDTTGEPYWVRDFFSCGGANNIGLLVKMTGEVGHSGDGFFYLNGTAVYDDGTPSVNGVRVDWPFAAAPPVDGSFVTILGISSCRVVHDDVAGDVVVRMLRPVSADAVKTTAL